MLLLGARGADDDDASDVLLGARGADDASDALLTDCGRDCCMSIDDGLRTTRNIDIHSSHVKAH